MPVELTPEMLRSLLNGRGRGQLTIRDEAGNVVPFGEATEAERIIAALLIAVRQDDPDLIEEVIEHARGVRFDPLSLAITASRRDARVFDHLVGAGADVEARDADGRTALIVAIDRLDLDAVERLLAHGADPLVRLPDGTTALARLRDRLEREPPGTPREPFEAMARLLKEAGAEK